MAFDIDEHWSLHGNGHWSAAFERSWYQGRGVYGGLIAAGFAHAFEQKAGPDRPMRSLTVHYCEPAPEGDARLEVEQIRAGKNVTQLRGELLDSDGTITAIASSSAGAPRQTVLERRAIAMPDSPSITDLQQAPYVEGAMPAFGQHFDYWYLEGIPWTGASQARLRGWIRCKGGGAPGTPMVAALMDAWAPAVLSLFESPAGAASMDLTMHFYNHRTVRQLAEDAIFLYSAATRVVADGYAEEAGWLWTESGELVCQARQLIALFG